MNLQNLNKVLTLIISAVWLVNGIVCKIFNLVPRHQEIVATILGDSYSFILTKAIGVSEVLMAVWVLSGIKSKICALSQIGIVLLMNILELTWASELLYWGSFNLLFASLFSAMVFCNEFLLKKL